jgi:hypothetical protein
MVTNHTPNIEHDEYARTQPILLNPCYFELYNTEDHKNYQQVEEEIYYEKPDLLGGIEGIDCDFKYGVDCEDAEEEV